MPIYGYRTTDGDATQPALLSEVTFQFCPEDLRRVARFLLERADEIDAGKFVDGGRHLRDIDPGWQTEHHYADIIVVPASTATPDLG